MIESYATKTNADLVVSLREVDLLAANLSDLLVEMWKRGLREAHHFAVKLMLENGDGDLNRHPDERLYDVLEILSGGFKPLSAESWLQLASGYEQRILDALMINTVRSNPRIGFEVLDGVAKDNCDKTIDKALISVVSAIPENTEGLQECLMRWVEDQRIGPNSRVAIFRRLGELQWNEQLEDFLVRASINDNGYDAALTESISEALRP